MMRALVSGQHTALLPTTWTVDEAAAEDCSGVLTTLIGSVVDHAVKHGYVQVRPLPVKRAWHTTAGPCWRCSRRSLCVIM